MRPDIKVWNPENPAQWNKTLAWTTVWLSTFSLTFGFCAWFLVPSLAPRLTEIGFSLTHSQLYWLVAMVGLSAGTASCLSRSSAGCTPFSTSIPLIGSFSVLLC